MLRDPGKERVDADPVHGRAEVDRVDERAARLDGQLLAQPRICEGGLVPDVRLEDRLVMTRESLRHCRSVRLVVCPERHERGVASTDLADRAHRDHRGRKPARKCIEDPRYVCPGAIDLVDEDKGRDAEPLQRAEQERCLWLDALHGRDDEHGAVEHAQDALDLCDEVRVAGRVDQIDGKVADLERGDGGSDGDAALAFQIERVGLCGASVDRADAIDGAGGEEEPFGEGGLTCVYVGEDAEIERTHGASCRARRWSPSGWTRLLPFRSLSWLHRGCAPEGSHAGQDTAQVAGTSASSDPSGRG